MNVKPFSKRWTGAFLGFALGAVDTLFLRAIGVELPLWVGAYFTLSFVGLGFLLGLALELRAAERAAARAIAEQSRRLAETQARVLHLDKLACLGQVAGT